MKWYIVILFVWTNIIIFISFIEYFDRSNMCMDKYKNIDCEHMGVNIH